MSALFVIVPLFLLFLFFIFVKKFNFLQSLSYSIILWLTFLVISTEILSFFELITFQSLLSLWLGVTCVLGVIVRWQLNDKKGALFLLKKRSVKKMDREKLFAASLFLLLVGIICLSALWAAPNTYDVQTYHLSRVEHWIQNQTLKPYATQDVRQIAMPLLSEMILMHLRILSHSDHLSNLLQWLSFVLCPLIVYGVYKQVYPKAKDFWSVSFFIITIPMAILQATSAKNDLLLSLLLSIFIYCVVTYKRTTSHMLVTGLSLGLLLLVKGTAYIYAAPFALWLLGVIHSLKTRPFPSFLSIVFVAIAINTGFFYRNIYVFSRPLELNQGVKYTDDIFSLEVCLSNAFKNIALHIGSPHQKINDSIQKLIIQLHEVLFTIDINDPGTMWLDQRFFSNPFELSEDLMGNPLHLGLIFAAAFLIVVRSKKVPMKLRIYGLSVLCAFFLFSFILKWQIWHTRLHLPLFIISAPLVGYLMENIPTHFRKAILVSLILSSLPAIFINKNRPLLGEQSIFTVPRIEQHFGNDRSMKLAYQNAVHFAVRENPSSVGLIFPHGNILEYPLFVLFREENYSVKLEHIEVRNATRILEKEKEQYTTILCVQCEPRNSAKYSAAGYETKDFGFVRVFTKIKNHDAIQLKMCM